MRYLVVASMILAVGCGRGDEPIAPEPRWARLKECIAPAIAARKRCTAKYIKLARYTCSTEGRDGIAPDLRTVVPGEEAQCRDEWYFGTDEFPGWAQECTAAYESAVEKCE